MRLFFKLNSLDFSWIGNYRSRNVLIDCWTIGECVLKDEEVDDSWMSSFIRRQLRLAQMFTSKKEEIRGTWWDLNSNLSKYLMELSLLRVLHAFYQLHPKALNITLRIFFAITFYHLTIYRIETFSYSSLQYYLCIARALRLVVDNCWKNVD